MSAMNGTCASRRRDASRRAGLLLAAAAPLWLLLQAATLAAASREPLPRGTPASRLAKGDTATEYWDLLAELDSGHRVFVRFSITNEGPGSETAYAIGHVVSPNGRSFPFTNGRRKGRWSLSPDGLHIKIGGSELIQRDPTRRLWINKADKGVFLDLSFQPPGLGRPQDMDAARYWTDVLHLATPVAGQLFLPSEMAEPLDVRGRIAGTHTWMEESESALALRRIELFSLHPQEPLYLSTLTAPQGTAQKLLLERGGRVTLETDAFQVLLSGSGPDTREGYPVPQRLEIRGPGIEGEVRLGRLLLQNDPMGLIPQPFRWFLSFKMQPHRVWIESEFEVRLRGDSDDPYRELRGSGVTAVSFLKPLDLSS